MDINTDWVPTLDNVIIRRTLNSEVEGKQTKLEIPGTAQTLYWYGEIVSIGPGRYNLYGQRTNLDLKVGDTVLFTYVTNPPPQKVNPYKDDLFFVKLDSILAFSRKEEKTNTVE